MPPIASPIKSLINSLCARNYHRPARNNPAGQPIVAPQPPTLSSTPSHERARPHTPNGLFPQNIGLGSVLPHESEEKVIEVMKQGLAKGTRNNYSSAITNYLKYCNTHNVDFSMRFPADERVLCAFISSLDKKIAGSTASTIITALKRWHELHNVEWKGSERLLLAVRGIKNNTTSESRRPKRRPVTPKMLEDLHNALDHNDPKDIAILACAKSAFWGQARIGEFLTSSRLKHDPTSQPSRNSIIILLNINAREICLPKTKTHQAEGESIYLARQSDPLDPVKALEDHLRINNTIDPDDHLFAFIAPNSKSGRHSLTHEDFIKRINEALAPLGYHRITGHDFRIGGTTTLLRNGVPPEVVKELGRWSSDAFFEYWRDLPAIAARHTTLLNISPNNSIIRSSNNSGQARGSLIRANTRESRNHRRGRRAFQPY